MMNLYSRRVQSNIRVVASEIRSLYGLNAELPTEVSLFHIHLVETERVYDSKTDGMARFSPYLRGNS